LALRTPLYEAHLAASARMVEFAGWDMPVQYAGVLEEHAAVRERCGVFDVSHMGEVTLEGPRALEAAQRLVTNDLSKCRDGQAQYSALCNEAGGVIDDIIVYRFSAERLFVCVNASGREKDFAWMKEHAERGGGVRVEQHSDDWAQVAVQGPRAPALVDSLCQPKVLDLGYYHFRSAAVAGIDGCIVARTGYTGEDGFEISLSADHAVGVAERLLAEPEVAPIGLGARDTLRLEAGLCLYGHDIDETTTPIEAGLAWTIGKRQRAEAGFPGASIILRQLAEGPARKRVGIRPDGRAPAREGTPIVDTAGNPIGQVTSGGFGPSVNAPIAMGYVDAARSAEGSALAVVVRDVARPAHVARLPFVPTRYYRG
jgi:aminomethyltransferase